MGGEPPRLSSGELLCTYPHTSWFKLSWKVSQFPQNRPAPATSSLPALFQRTPLCSFPTNSTFQEQHRAGHFPEQKQRDRWMRRAAVRPCRGYHGAYFPSTSKQSPDPTAGLCRRAVAAPAQKAAAGRSPIPSATCGGPDQGPHRAGAPTPGPPEAVPSPVRPRPSRGPGWQPLGGRAERGQPRPRQAPAPQLGAPRRAGAAPLRASPGPSARRALLRSRSCRRFLLFAARTRSQRLRFRSAFLCGGTGTSGLRASRRRVKPGPAAPRLPRSTYRAPRRAARPPHAGADGRGLDPQ